MVYTEAALIVRDKFERCNEKQSAKARGDDDAVVAANASVVRRRLKL
ncbi:MAG TPA: hypothetical protein VIP53_05585 [Nitrososphaera sp.]